MNFALLPRGPQPPADERQASSTINSLACRVVLSLPSAGINAGASGDAEDIYPIDQRCGTVEFSVDHLGLFTSRGQFRRFGGRLALNFADPALSRISFGIDAGSVVMGWNDGAAMLRSPAYFDVQRHPQIRFRSTMVMPLYHGHYVVQGLIDIRGISQVLTLDARLARRSFGLAPGGEVADVIVTGRLRRSAFGMVADQALISDDVDIQMQARISVNAQRPFV